MHSPADGWSYMWCLTLRRYCTVLRWIVNLVTLCRYCKTLMGHSHCGLYRYRHFLKRYYFQCCHEFRFTPRCLWRLEHFLFFKCQLSVTDAFGDRQAPLTLRTVSKRLRHQSALCISQCDFPPLRLQVHGHILRCPQ